MGSDTACEHRVLRSPVEPEHGALDQEDEGLEDPVTTWTHAPCIAPS